MREDCHAGDAPAVCISVAASGWRDKEYKERMAEVRVCALTSCFVRHLPSSVSSALAGGVTSVTIASSSAEKRQHCEHSTLRETQQELSWQPGDSTQNQYGIYLPSPSTAAVVLWSTPFLETQQTAAKTVAGQKSRKGKMLLQNTQIILQTLMGSQLLQAPPALTLQGKVPKPWNAKKKKKRTLF